MRAHHDGTSRLALGLGALAAVLALTLAACPSEARGQGAVAFQPIPVPIFDGSTLSVTPVVSADRRYVRLGVRPIFQTVEGFDTFPVPAAVAGGGIGGFGGLGGLGGGGGGLRSVPAGAGGKANAAGRAAVPAPAPVQAGPKTFAARSVAANSGPAGRPMSGLDLSASAARRAARPDLPPGIGPSGFEGPSVGGAMPGRRLITPDTQAAAAAAAARRLGGR